MKVLLLNQFFHPDAAPTGELLADLARRLADDGCEVTVFCGRNHCAAGAEIPCANVIRVWLPRAGRGFASRVFSHGWFLLAAIRHAARDEADLVVTLTSPPLLALSGTLAKWTRGARHFIWEMDVYPDIAVDLGVLGATSWTTRLLRAIAALTRRRADGVIVLGSCMRDRLLSQGLAPERVHIVENWADGERIRPLPRPADGPLRVLYSGNLGLAHDEQTICGAMAALRSDGRFHFTFAGGGSRRETVERFCRARGISNVTFKPYCDRADLAAELAKADLGLVTQRPECLGSVVPSKLYSLMAAARPVLFIGPGEGAAARLVDRHRCGWRAVPGDSRGVTALLQHLADRPNLLREAGIRGRDAFLREHDRHIGTARISTILGASAPAKTFAAATAS